MTWLLIIESLHAYSCRDQNTSVCNGWVDFDFLLKHPACMAKLFTQDKILACMHGSYFMTQTMAHLSNNHKRETETKPFTGKECWASTTTYCCQISENSFHRFWFNAKQQLTNLWLLLWLMDLPVLVNKVAVNCTVCFYGTANLIDNPSCCFGALISFCW